MGRSNDDRPFEAVRGPGARYPGKLVPDRIKRGWPAPPCKTIGDFSNAEIRDMERRYAPMVTLAMI